MIVVDQFHCLYKMKQSKWSAINGYVEIDIRDKIDSSEKFKCDYTHGILYFDQSLNGMSININKYYSRGQFYLPASRIWTKIDDFDNVTETLDDTVGKLADIENIIDNLDSSTSQAVTQKNELDLSIDEASTINDILSNTDNGTIKLANEINIVLSDTTANASAQNTELNSTISSAESIKYVLDEKVEDIEVSSPFVEKFIADENQQEFTLTQGQYKDIPMTQVYVQGVYIDPIEDFILIEDGQQNKIFINEPLPQGAEVRVHVLQTLPIDTGGIIIP